MYRKEKTETTKIWHKIDKILKKEDKLTAVYVVAIWKTQTEKAWYQNHCNSKKVEIPKKYICILFWTPFVACSTSNSCFE